MGEPVRIADIARRLSAQSAHPVDIVYTGLRPGEKLREELFNSYERSRPTSAEKIRLADLAWPSPGSPPQSAGTVRDKSF